MQLLCRFVGNLGRAERRDASGTLLKTRASPTTAGISSGGRVGAVALCIIKIRIKIWQHGMKILPNYEGHRVKKLDFLTFSLLVYGLSFDEQLKTAHFHTDFKTYVDILAVDPHAW